MNKEQILESIRQNKNISSKDISDFSNDYDIMFSGISQGLISLELASEELRNNKAIVMVAVLYRGLSLEFASLAFKNDKEVVLLAIKKSGSSLEYASSDLNNNKDRVIYGNQKWLSKKMDLLSKLEIKEQESWMMDNIPSNRNIYKTKKF